MSFASPNAESCDPSEQRPSPPNAIGEWLRSSYCTSGTCVEAQLTHERISIRDGKENDRYEIAELQPMLHVAPAVFSVFLKELIGEVGAGANGELTVSETDIGDIKLSSTMGPVELTYHADEWQAFCEGVSAGEFAISD